jgi:AcrR family transcriptional regulator
MNTPLETSKSEKPPHTPHGEAQRAALVRAAYDLIAEKGFEGLRTRDVAERAGVNIATLHYYFKHKDDLIRSVVEYTREQFKNRHAPSSQLAISKPLDYVRQEFADVAYHAQELSENFLVWLEILLHSLRDTAIKQVFEDFDDSWLHVFETYLAEGVQQGVFRSDLDIGATAAALIAFIKGAMVQMLFSPQTFPAERVYAQIERWLTEPSSGLLAPGQAQTDTEPAGSRSG